MQGGGFIPDDLPGPSVAPRTVLGPRPSVDAFGYDDDFDHEAAAAMDELEGRGAAPAHRSPPRPARSATTCVDCGDAEGQQRFAAAFGISVCYDCQRAAKANGGKYQLISKTKAKDEYLLSDQQLSAAHGGLGCLAVANTTYSQRGEVKLYLRTQCEQAALAKWGSEEALFEEQTRRSRERLERQEKKATSAKRKAAGPADLHPSLAREQSGGAVRKRKAAEGGASARKANTSRQVDAIALTAPHEHEFLPDETYDADKDVWTKRCACGFQLSYERI